MTQIIIIVAEDEPGLNAVVQKHSGYQLDRESIRSFDGLRTDKDPYFRGRSIGDIATQDRDPGVIAFAIKQS